MKQDKISRFLFNDADVRGEIVQLEHTVESCLKNHHYPDAVKHVLSELLCATSLLTATLKFEGEITMQLQGDGCLSLAVVSGSHTQALRGLARFDKDKLNNLESFDLPSLFGKGQLIITITPTLGQRYQGVIAIDKNSIAECLEQYFAQSEQLKTRIWLFSDKRKAAGMLLQILPTDDNNDQEQQFEHLETLGQTITADELINLDVETILKRLYHEENIQLFDSEHVSFQCTCSKSKTQQAIASLGIEEAKASLTDGKIIINCEFCNAEYTFDEIDIMAIFANAQPEKKTKQ